MSATEELRRLLDERGVEWRKPSPEYWVLLGMPEGDSSTIVGELSIEEATDGTLVIWNATPEQAVEVALNQVVRHPKPHEQWTTVLLPEIAWSLDDRWPDYLSVAHDANGEWRVYVPEATLRPLTERAVKDSEKDSDERGECRMDYLCDGYLYFRSYWCRECNERFAYRLIGHDDALPKHCPNCGAGAVVE